MMIRHLAILSAIVDVSHKIDVTHPVLRAEDSVPLPIEEAKDVA